MGVEKGLVIGELGNMRARPLADDELPEFFEGEEPDEHGQREEEPVEGAGPGRVRKMVLQKGT